MTASPAQKTAAAAARWRRFGRWALFLSPAAAFLLVLLVRFFNREMGIVTAVPCASNLRQIGQGCVLFANDHEGCFPVSFAELLKSEDISPAVFACPNMSTPVPATVPSDWPDTCGDYAYVGAGLRTDAPPEVIVAYEPVSNHAGRGSNLLFADGHVEFVARAELAKTFRDSDAAREKWEEERSRRRAATRRWTP